MPIVQSRRHLLTNIAVAGATGFAGLGAAGLYGGRKSVAAEPPPEVTTIRLERDPVICITPQVAEALLRQEGFTDIRYVDVTESDNVPGVIPHMMAQGEVDFGRSFAPDMVIGMDVGAPVTILAGLHSGCFEILGRDDIRRITDLKGRTIGVAVQSDKALLTIMTRLVGLDPDKDIHWIISPTLSPAELFLEGKIDAFLGVPPILQEVRERHIGHTVASSITDHPWSDYFCCLFAASTEFTRRYPVATKRVLRAFLKTMDLCASNPGAAAHVFVDQGITPRYDYAQQMLSEIRYDIWRDYDPEDTVRFYALRLHEAGIVKSGPQTLIARHTDWRFLNELKREMKT
ncbi:MAG: ABC transporter substrate-binding protein [Rhodopila sp.]